MDNHFGTSYLPYAPAPSAQTPSLAAAYGSQPQTPQQSGTPQAPQQQQQQQQQHPSNDNALPTLPPLQGQNGFAQYGGMSFGHPASGSQTPTAPPTPITQASNGYAHVSPASAMAPPHNAYASPYPIASQSMMFPSSTASSLAPSTTTGPGLPTIRPMPPSSISASLASLPSLATAHLSQQQSSSSFMQNEEAPTHVVGSQGRRGILPSAPGRPSAAAATATASTKTMNLQKDADGKFPCPHCNKTYLHAKHLKRHMLRHTGDRPYSCHLCKDTFSRSDILKRHFQKCSIRRGNPTGLSHLAHQRRSGTSNNNNNNRLSISQQDGPIGLAGLQEVAGNNHPYSAGGMEQGTPVNGNASNRTSRANSLITPASMSHRNSIAGLGIVSPNGQGPDMAHPQSHFAAPNMHPYGMTNSGPMANAYAFSQPAMNNQFYQAMHSQQQLPYLGHASSRYDQSHSNSPHQHSPTVADASQQQQQQLDGSRMLGHAGQDSFINGNVSLGADAGKSEHDKHFTNDFGGEHQPALAQAWS